MPFDPTLPANNSPLDADEVRNQFNGLKALLDTGNVPVGCVLAYLKSLPGAPALAVNATTASAASTDSESSLPSYYDVVWVMRVK